MYNHKKSGVLGIIITIVILIILVIVTNIETSKLYNIENVISKIITPVQNGITYLQNKISGNSAFFADMNQLKQENQELKQKNSELEQQLRELEIIKTENETLKQYETLAEKYKSYKTIPAYVINRDITNYSKTIVINVGKDDGIKENMTVIADEGLVGNVISVTSNTAKVQTIIDSASSTSAITSSTRDTMVCKGTIDGTSALKATYIAIDSNIIEGDSVECSGMGGIYPKGIYIGRVTKVTQGKNKIDKVVEVQTAVNFDKLETVLIITNED